MPANPVKSAIKEVRDQLFLDRAVGKYLSNISTNLNFERPQLGFADDDIWRALVRRAALDYRQIPQLFRDYLTIIYGPQKTVYTLLGEAAASTDTEITILDPERIPQIGTLVIDEGQATQETLAYSFRDPRNGVITLKDQANKTHLASLAENVSGEIKVDASVAATTLVLFDSSRFPITGFPYTMILAPGTEYEEVTTLIGNNWVLNQLTISPGLTLAKHGPGPTPITSSLTNVAAGKTVIRLSSTEAFPAEGTIRLIKNDGLTTTSELAIFTQNDVETGTLFLTRALTNTYPTALPGTTVTLMTTGETAALAQVQVKGVGWDLFVTNPNELTIYIPREEIINRMQDASWLHIDGAISASSTVAAGSPASIGDTQIKVTASGLAPFPSAGLLTINSGGASEEVIGYYRHDSNSYTRLVPSATSGIPSGATVLHVECARFLSEFDWYNRFKKLYLGRGTANLEVVTYTEIDTEANTVTLASPTTLSHAGQDQVHLFDWPDILYLDRPLEKAHAAGQAIQYTRPVYSATTIHDGRIFTAVSHLFQGPFLTEFNEHIPRSISTQLAESVAGPTQLVASQLPGYYTLEVDDASLFDANGYFNVEIKGGGYEEIIDTDTVVLQTSVSGVTLSGLHSAGSTVLALSSAAALPAPASAPYGYRLVLDPGTVNAEVVIVWSISGNNVTLEQPTTLGHAGGVGVELMADVIVLVDPVGYEYRGKVPKTQRLAPIPGPLTLYAQVAWAREVRTYVRVNDVSSFTNGEDQVIITHGYDTQEVVTYNGVATTPNNRLSFPDGIKFSQVHALGDMVYLSGIHDRPVGDGNDHVFYLPSSPEDRLRYLFDRGRAAGVKITVIDSK